MSWNAKIIISLAATAVIVGGITMISMVGCGGNSPDKAIQEANKTNIERLANLYVMYQAKNRLAGPEDEESFKEFIRNASDGQIQRMGVDKNDLDSLFVSERDGRPFKIRYGVPGSTRGSVSAVIFESTPQENGMYMVAFTSMVEKEVDQDEYDSLWRGEGDKAGPGFSAPIDR